jgi:hypothetical protein
MGKIHNKKRNIGIIYEQLLKSISKYLVEGDQEKYRAGFAILKRNFKPGSQLYREFRLFNALVKTTVYSDTLAVRILGEARKAALEFDAKKLQEEKSRLIKEINHGLDYPEFYRQPIGNYRSYATIQTLLNDWRKKTNADLSRIAKYENQVCQWLIAEKKVPASFLDYHDANVNRLTVKIMMEKFNQKYARDLSGEQGDLIKEYVFCVHNGTRDEFTNYLSSLRDETITELEMFVSQSRNHILQEKLDRVKQSISDISISDLSDTTISKFLVISQLKQELLENINE